MDTKSSLRQSIASESWTDAKVEEFKARVVDTSEIQELLPREYTPNDNGNDPFRWILD